MRIARRFFSSVLILATVPGLIFGQTPCAPQKHAKLPFVLDLTYHKARPRLLRAGWQPYPTIHHNDITNPRISYGSAKIFWKKGYWEIEECAGTGLDPCAFLFEDAYGNKLRVTTAGEEHPGQKYVARVTGYKFVCGDLD
ncbi:MAG: hypothetical protein IPL32_15235 [Chloracidobacterium sp.]|nr:hypothetical protein [Chloracidobacterium sp.]